MADETWPRGPADETRIDLHEDDEWRFWMERFGCTREQLKSAVKAVGSGVEAVERHLAAHV